MKKLTELLKAKPDQTVHTISPSAPVLDAIKSMAEKHIGALLVMEGGRVAGIVTERDYARKVVLMSRSSADTPVRDIMTSSVMFVRPDQSCEECMVLMTEKRLRHLPVIDGDRLVGLVSIGDLVKEVISDQQFTIEQLQHYISGDRS